jgi:signal transduction histidine kinase
MTQHDLKNPLNALMGYPQLLLLDDNLTLDQRHYLEQMLKAGNEMLNIINNSLDLFKMETGRYQYRPNIVDIVTVLQEIQRDLRMLLQEYQVKIQFQVTGQEDNENQGFILSCDRSLSYSLFANLIRNAIEACSADDTITIVMHYENNEGVISITNPGCVPASIRDTFFEKYSTAGKTHGTGLGTYSAKLMAETQNGSIAMTTNSKETCITVKLATV